MDFRFTLSHTPRQSISSDVDFPDNSEGSNVSGSGNDWTDGANPTVAVSGSIGIRQSDIWANGFTFATGLNYTVNYSIDYNINVNVISTVIHFVVLDGANNILVDDGKAVLSTGSGTLNDSTTFTAPGGAVKYGFYVVINNVLSNAGSTFDINNSITGTVATEAEPGSPTSLEISEPDGWKQCKLKLERHEDFHSLVEYYEGGAGGAFIFYGDNGEENGGIDFLKGIEQIYGFDAQVNILTEFSFDGINYEEIFSGQVDISAKDEMVDSLMQAPIIRDDFWAKFINRRGTQIDLSSNVDLDGRPVEPAMPVTVNLVSQRIRYKYQAAIGDAGLTYGSITNNNYEQIDFNDIIIIDEISEKFILPRVENTELPAPMFFTEYGGEYTFDIRIVASTPDGFTDASVKNPTDMIDFYIQFNNASPVAFSWSDVSSGGSTRTVFTYSGSHDFTAATQIRIYGQANTTSSDDINISGGTTVTPGLTGEYESFLFITADTTFDNTTAQGFLIHDLFYAVLQRMGLGQSPFYSEFLGSTLTNYRQYIDNGCGWMYVIIKGLQIRQYTLTEKPFFISFNQIWEGIHPILCLGLAYEELDDSPAARVIRVEQMDHFFSDDVSVNFSNVRNIHSYYDKERIFKTIKTGYKKWQSEDISGIDDPQTKHTYATRFEKAGKDLPLESDFIAAGLAIETTRRTTIEKSADYKYDNENFIIAISENDVSPDRYSPEQDENFDGVSGLLNSNTRYNLILTPMRNFLRWAKYIGGCMQPYATSAYRFVSGEGNYDMLTDYSCASGNQCQAIICDPLSERQDIPLADYNSVFGYLHLAQECEMTIPMEKSEYDIIKSNPKKAIGISQTEDNHTVFKIKKLEYDLIQGQATIQAWPKTYFNIQVIPSEVETEDCETIVSIYHPFYQAILDRADDLGYTTPSFTQKAKQNQLVVDLVNSGAWFDLDVLYIFASNGDSDFATINWIDPDLFQCVKNNSPAFIPDIGFEGNGVNSYLDTTWIPSTHAVKFTLNDGCALCAINNDTAATGAVDFGTRSGVGTAGQFILVSKSNTVQHNYAINSGGVFAGTTVSSDGFYQIRRVANNDQRLFKNGSQVGSTSTQVTNSLSTRSVYLFRDNNGGGASTHSDRQISMFGAGASLSGDESDIYDIWTDYFTSL